MSDFLVIGGGIAGVSVAARLAPHGSVTLLEAETALGYHASGRSAALYEASYGRPTTLALNEASRDHFVTGGYLGPRGLMVVAAPDEIDAFEADLSEMKIPEIGPDEALGLVPILRRDRLARAAWHEDAWDVDTDRLIQDFARTVRAHGGAVLTGRRVGAIAREGTLWRVMAGDEAFTAPILVNAAGAWADRIAVLAGVPPLGLQPNRRSMARIPAPGGHDVSGWPMFFGAGEGWYAKPDAGKLLVSPADEDPMEPFDAWPDDMVLAEGLARYEAMVTEPVTRVETSWAGLRTFAPDRSLVLGPEPGVAGFFWSAGQGGYGFQTAPAASACLAAQITGGSQPMPADILRALQPARLR
ncbi:NAD(P)/FAD-dependent oxidoreductase [Palleronia sp. KMU-117]|uniref:NAD(P)/FAD-dependent oxidoreductase n=1 Tax=Palleronia sp. KMU-117 TaxID=3434108 RepID=UPI003D72A673